MGFDLEGLQSYFTTIGSALGIISAIILFYRYSREKAILEFALEECYHYAKDMKGNGALGFTLSVDNVGERGTTIKGIDLLETRPVDYAKYYGEWKCLRDFKHIPPHSSMGISTYCQLKNKVISEDVLDFDILVVYTHGSSRLTGISRIRQ